MKRLVPGCFALLVACAADETVLPPTGTTAQTGGGGADGGAPGGGGTAGMPSAQGGGGQSPAPTADPIACIGCVAQSCPDLLACVQDPVCGPGVACVVTQCATNGGTPDLACALGCFGGDPAAALGAIQAVSCIATACGDACAGVVPGLPGG